MKTNSILINNPTRGQISTGAFWRGLKGVLWKVASPSQAQNLRDRMQLTMEQKYA